MSLHESMLVYLDTRHRNSGVNSNAVFNMNEARIPDRVLGFLITLLSVEFNNTVYPVNANNNVISYQEAGPVNFTATMTPNHYTGAQLATELQTQMNAAASTGVFTVTYNAQSRLMTLASTVAFTIVAGTASINDVIGINALLHGAFLVSHVSDYPVDISGTRYVDIEMNFALGNYAVNNSSQSTILRIPTVNGFGEFVNYVAPNEQYAYVDTSRLNALRCLVRDDQHNQYLLPNNSYISYVFKFIPILVDRKILASFH